MIRTITHTGFEDLYKIINPIKNGELLVLAVDRDPINLHLEVERFFGVLKRYRANKLLIIYDIDGRDAETLKRLAMENNIIVIATHLVENLNDMVGNSGIDETVFKTADKVVTLYKKTSDIAEFHVIKNRGAWLGFCWMSYGNGKFRTFDYDGYYCSYEMLACGELSSEDEHLIFGDLPQSLLDFLERDLQRKSKGR